ncbi:MAG: recombinase family protein [Waterburya sp.]
MRIIGYERVSSGEQATKGYSLEVQKQRLLDAGATEILVDIESAYKDRKRPNLDRLLEKIKAREVDLIVATRLDRLSRRNALSFEIFELCEKYGVSLKLLDEPIDLETPVGKMLAGLLAIFAQHHSDQKSQNIKQGLQNLRGKGEALRPPFGYRKENKKLVFDLSPYKFSQQEVGCYELAREAIDLFLVTKTLRQPLAILKKKYKLSEDGNPYERGRFFRNAASFRSWLLNPVLRGSTQYLTLEKQSVVKENTHLDRLLTDDEYSTIRSILQANKEVKGFGAIKDVRPLTGLVVCGECGAKCAGSTAKGTNGLKRYYYCRLKQNYSCNQRKYIKAEVLENAAIESIIDRAEEIATITAIPEKQVNCEPLELKNLRSQLAALELIPNPQPSIQNAIADLKHQIDFFSLDRSESPTLDFNLVFALTSYLEDKEVWLSLQRENRREIYRKLIDRIVVRDGDIVEIKLKF